MDPRRIQKTGTQGLAQKHKDNRSKIGSFQKQGTGGVQLPHISVFILETVPASQVIPHNTWTSVNFDYQEIDNYSIQEDIGNPNFNFTSETSGFWLFTTSATFDNNDQHDREIKCVLNNTTDLPQSLSCISATAAKGSGFVSIQSHFMVSVNEGDSLKMQVKQTSNDDRDLNHASFQGFKIGS